MTYLHYNNYMDKKETPPPQLVQDRKTGEWYNPLESWYVLMNREEIKKVFENLKNL